MANKTKRSVSTGRASTSTSTAVAGTPRAGSRAFSTEFKPDYTQVKDDLKRIAYLAGTFILILVVLSFFLR
jgi:hypothetical protein